MTTKLFMADRTNYKNEDFSNENWREVTLQEAYDELWKMVGRDLPRDCIVREQLSRVERCAHEVMRFDGGVLLQFEPDEDFEGWNLYAKQ